MLEKIVKSAATLCFLILVFATVSHAQVCQPAPVGLVSWWSGDGNLLDSRSRLNGTLVGNTGFAAGQVGQAYNLDGNNDFVQIAPSASHDISGPFTAEAWIFPRTFPNLGPRIFDKDGNTGTRWLMSMNNSSTNPSSLVVAINSFFIVTPPNSLQLDQWNHVAFSYNPVSGDLIIYINGLQSATGNQIGLDSTNPAPLVLGDDFVTSTREFDGLIDEPAIYNRALPASEIAAIHAAGTAGKCKPTATVAPSGQVMWFAGDGDADDTAGANSGILQNGAAIAVGKVGQSFSLDGVNDFVSLGDPPNLKFTNADFTVEGWFMTPDVPTNQGTQCGPRYPIFGYDFGYTVEVGGDGRLRFRKFIDQDASFSLDSLSPISTNTFHHFAAIHTPTEMRLFVDGVLVNTRPINNGNIFYFAGDVPELGRFDCGLNGVTEFYFKGKIDETSVYSRALTSGEITSIFNAGIAGKLKEATTTGTIASVGDVTITYPVPSTRRTHQISLEDADMPTLPLGMTPTGLLYDIATDVLPSGTTDLCFSLQAFAALSNAEFLERRVLHLESGSWINRTTTLNFATKTICAQVLSLSPFAIVDSNIAPTAANVSVGGRAFTTDGRAISGGRVSITDESGSARSAVTNSFGYYRFDGVEIGRMYVVSIEAKRHQFDNPTRTITLIDELTDLDFSASPDEARDIKASDPFSSLSRWRAWRR